MTHITLGRTPLDEGSARRRLLYLKAHNFHNRQISVTPTRFEPAITAIGRPQNHILHLAATRIGELNNLSCKSSSSVICQTTGPKPLAKRFLHIVQSRASSFNSQYPLLSLRSSSNFLRLLPCLLVTSICSFIFPSITCFRRQFLRKM